MFVESTDLKTSIVRKITPVFTRCYQHRFIDHISQAKVRMKGFATSIDLQSVSFEAKLMCHRRRFVEVVLLSQKGYTAFLVLLWSMPTFYRNTLSLFGDTRIFSYNIPAYFDSWSADQSFTPMVCQSCHARHTQVKEILEAPDVVKLGPDMEEIRRFRSM